MKKIITIVFAFVFLNTYAQVQHPKYKDYLSDNIMKFDFSMGVGVFIGGQESTGMIDMDFTIKNIMIGIGFGGESTDGGSKTVSVSSHTRHLKNGKTTQVKSHKRSKPGQGGSFDPEFYEFHLGYWLPCFTIKNFKWYSAPIVGGYMKEEITQTEDYKIQRNSTAFLYGAGIKLSWFDCFGLTIKASNASATIGISYNYF